MSDETSVAVLKAEIAKCMQCGNCQAVCPIYKEEMAEWSVARGKINLARGLLEGRLSYTDRMEEIFNLCLTCQACVENCPCGVRPDKIILATRALLAREKGLPALKKYAFAALKRPGQFKLGLRIGSKLQGFGLKYRLRQPPAPHWPRYATGHAAPGVQDPSVPGARGHCG